MTLERKSNKSLELYLFLSKLFCSLLRAGQQDQIHIFISSGWEGVARCRQISYYLKMGSIFGLIYFSIGLVRWWCEGRPLWINYKAPRRRIFVHRIFEISSIACYTYLNKNSNSIGGYTNKFIYIFCIYLYRSLFIEFKVSTILKHGIIDKYWFLLCTALKSIQVIQRDI